MPTCGEDSRRWNDSALVVKDVHRHFPPTHLMRLHTCLSVGTTLCMSIWHSAFGGRCLSEHFPPNTLQPQCPPLNGMQLHTICGLCTHLSQSPLLSHSCTSSVCPTGKKVLMEPVAQISCLHDSRILMRGTCTHKYTDQTLA